MPRLTAVAESEPDLIVLDWMLPDLEGIEVGRRLRAQGFKTAILFLTAKDGVENKVEALRAGGDDYVTKPFSLAEVVARIRAILRRTEGEAPGEVLAFGDVVARRGPPRGLARRHDRRPDGDRVRAAAVLPAQPAARPLEGPDPAERLALRLRRQLERRRDLRQLPPPQARRARAAAHPHRAPGRLHPGRRPRDVLRRLSLRARLLLGVVALAAVGLVAADIATYSALRSFLMHRTDSSLNDAHRARRGRVLGACWPASNPAPAEPTRRPDHRRPDRVRAWRLRPGAASRRVGHRGRGRLRAAVRRAGRRPAAQAAEDDHGAARLDPRDRVSFFTVPAVSGGGHFRVRASIEAAQPNRILVIAAPLAAVEARCTACSWSSCS